MTSLCRPGDARRKSLNDELSVPTVSNFFPIERYFDAADKVYNSFQQAFMAGPNCLDDAYVYGKRYCMFCVDAIPKHHYFGATKYKHLSAKHKQQLDQVLAQLEQVSEAIDQQEMQRQRRLQEEEEKREAERLRLEAQEFQELQERAQRLATNSNDATTATNNDATSAAPLTKEGVQASALEKLELMRAQTLQHQQQTTTGRVRNNGRETTTRIVKQDPSGEEPKNKDKLQQQQQLNGTSRYRLLLSDDDGDDDDGDGAAAEEKKSNHGKSSQLPLPPPIPPTPPLYQDAVPLDSPADAPPSYEATLRSAKYHRTFLGPQPNLPPTPTTTTATRPQPPIQQQAKRQRLPPMRQLQEQYRTEYIQLTHRGRIDVAGLQTYQGRVPSSTNGCTVISALVAARHLSGRDGPEITDLAICDVIDRQCGPLLREIRGKLGLDGHALIIPSDVHDHLVDKKFLEQRYFEGAAGGNVLDPDHMGAFLKLLRVGEDGKGAQRKAAATFFFREHVISIVKIPQQQKQQGEAGGPVYYDLIDSLPTLKINEQTMATRTRCADALALEKLLQWYCSKKFSDSNCQYIDRNAWDDAMADLDPRVFQGFVWSVK